MSVRTLRWVLALWFLWPAVAAAQLSPSQLEDLARIEDYLNQLTTLDSRFIQLSSGNLAQGRLYLSRPGRLRIEYEPPVPVLIVASGRFMLYYDRELEQTTYVPISRTPAYFLLRDEVDLQNGINITGFERDHASIRVTVTEADDPEQGTLTVVFEDNPLRLVKWEVIDQQGQQINVSLLDPHFGLELDSDLFSTADPRIFGDPD